jgi:hypothetical protein
MSHSAISIATDRPFATVFYGGADRGKVIQFHMNPEDLTDLTLALYVYDEDLGGTSETFAEWIARNNRNVGMVLFDPYAEPKVGTVPIETTH